MRRSGWIIFVIFLVITIACIPAEAGQAGSSTSRLSGSQGHSSSMPYVAASPATVSGSNGPSFQSPAFSSPGENIPGISAGYQGLPGAGTTGTLVTDNPYPPSQPGQPIGNAVWLTTDTILAAPHSAPCQNPQFDSDDKSGGIEKNHAPERGGEGEPGQGSGFTQGQGSNSPLDKESGAPQPQGSASHGAGPLSAEQHSGYGYQAMGALVPAYAGISRLDAPGSDASFPVNPRHGPQRQQHGTQAPPVRYPCAPAQTSPLPSSTEPSQTESKEDTGSRPRSKRYRFIFQEIEPVETDAPSPSPLPASPLPFSLIMFGGFRRISRKNVLAHDTRGLIFQTIANRPGIDVTTIADTTGINENTLRYHLVKLLATGKITYLHRPGVVRYFRNQGAFGVYEQVIIHYLWTETPSEILWVLYRNPGITRQQVSDALSISGPSVTRQMEHLIEDGVVENRVPGRSNHYYLTNDATLVIARLAAPVREIMREDMNLQASTSPFHERFAEPNSVLS